MYRASRLCRR